MEEYHDIRVMCRAVDALFQHRVNPLLQQLLSIYHQLTPDWQVAVHALITFRRTSDDWKFYLSSLPIQSRRQGFLFCVCLIDLLELFYQPAFK